MHLTCFFEKCFGDLVVPTLPQIQQFTSSQQAVPFGVESELKESQP